MRNFWLDGTTPSRKTHITGGDNEMSIDLRAKVKGVSTLAIGIECKTMPDGTLRIVVTSPLTNEKIVVQDLETK